MLASLVMLACQIGCGPSRQEVKLGQLDLEAAVIIEDLISLYVSTETQTEALENLNRLTELYDDWRANRLIANSLEVDDSAYSRSGRSLCSDLHVFDIRFRSHLKFLTEAGGTSGNRTVTQTLEPFHQLILQDWSLLPARNRIR